MSLSVCLHIYIIIIRCVILISLLIISNPSLMKMLKNMSLTQQFIKCLPCVPGWMKTFVYSFNRHCLSTHTGH